MLFNTVSFPVASNFATKIFVGVVLTRPTTYTFPTSSVVTLSIRYCVSSANGGGTGGGAATVVNDDVNCVASGVPLVFFTAVVIFVVYTLE